MYYFLYGLWPRLRPSDHVVKILCLCLLAAIGICGVLLIIKGVLL